MKLSYLGLMDTKRCITNYEKSLNVLIKFGGQGMSRLSDALVVMDKATNRYREARHEKGSA
jgi:hypothetical protein